MTACLLLLVLAADPFADAVSDLAARSFRRRERAALALYEFGESALPRLRSAARQARDPEVRRRLEAVIERLAADRRAWAERTVKERYGECVPMIDALWLDESAGHYDPLSSTSRCRAFAFRRLNPYLVAALEERRPDLRRWGVYRQACAAWYVDLLEGGLPVWCLDLLCLEMRRRDNVWIGRHGWPPDPWHWPGTPPPACPGWAPALPGL